MNIPAGRCGATIARRESDKKNPMSGLSRCQLQTAVDRQWKTAGF
jgi:hypothetical protein